MLARMCPIGQCARPAELVGPITALTSTNSAQVHGRVRVGDVNEEFYEPFYLPHLTKGLEFNYTMTSLLGEGEGETHNQDKGDDKDEETVVPKKPQMSWTANDHLLRDDAVYVWRIPT